VRAVPEFYRESGSMESSDSIEIRLANSLKALAVREPFEKITIKKITDGAGVIRVTFYNHFQDKYELLEWIMRTEILDPVRILMQNEMFREAIVLIFTNMQKALIGEQITMILILDIFIVFRKLEKCENCLVLNQIFVL
jgi:AcrR family transcriptional regulator